MKTRQLSFALIFLFGILSCTESNINIEQQNKEIVKKSFEVVANGDYEGMNNYIANNYIRHSQATPQLDIEFIRCF